MNIKRSSLVSNNPTANKRQETKNEFVDFCPVQSTGQYSLTFYILIIFFIEPVVSHLIWDLLTLSLAMRLFIDAWTDEVKDLREKRFTELMEDVSRVDDDNWMVEDVIKFRPIPLTFVWFHREIPILNMFFAAVRACMHIGRLEWV